MTPDAPYIGPEHMAVLRAVRGCPDSSTSQIRKRTVPTAPALLRDLQTAGMVTSREHRWGQGNRMWLWRAL